MAVVRAIRSGTGRRRVGRGSALRGGRRFAGVLAGSVTVIDSWSVQRRTCVGHTSDVVSGVTASTSSAAAGRWRPGVRLHDVTQRRPVGRSLEHDQYRVPCGNVDQFAPIRLGLRRHPAASVGYCYQDVGTTVTCVINTAHVNGGDVCPSRQWVANRTSVGSSSTTVSTSSDTAGCRRTQPHRPHAWAP